MQIFVTKDYQEMSRSRRRHDCRPGRETWLRVGLATGSTPEGLYAEIAKRHEAEDIDFSRVATFNLDEYRGLPADHEQSYGHYFMQKHLFSKINVRPGEHACAQWRQPRCSGRMRCLRGFHPACRRR